MSRTVRFVQDVKWLPQLCQWEKLNGLIKVISERREKNKTSTECSYYLTSLDADGKKVAEIIKNHWSIENNLHWQLDVNFVEDDSVANTGYAAENLSIFRRIHLIY